MKRNDIFRVLLCLTLALLLVGCGAQEQTPTTAPTVPAETAAPVTEAPTQAPTEAATEPATIPTEAVEDLNIVTPYATLCFPGDWAPFLQTDMTTGTPCTVTFYAVVEGHDPQPVFTITFDGDAKKAVGALKTSKGYVPVEAESLAFQADNSWTDREANIVFTLREKLGYVMEKLALEDVSKLPKPTTNPTTSTNPTSPTTGNQDPTQAIDPEDLAIDTPYFELHFPSEWADYLSITVEETGDAYGVVFSAVIGSHSTEHLFTVWFGGDQGTELKTFKAADGQMVTIRIAVTELFLDGSWTESERSTIYAMQEDLNYLLGRLS